MMGLARFVFSVMGTVAIIAICIDGKELLDEQEIEAERLLNLFNKPALKSIKSEDGDIIDCVPITSQPAFDNPLLKNHTIQMRPSFIQEDDSTYTKKKTKHNTQSWQKNGEYCPRNTVPIRRINKEDILRAKSLESFRQKHYQSIPQANPAAIHEYAIMKSQKGKYFGTKFAVNLWRPEVQIPEEFSLFQTWISSQSGDRSTLNTIEAGFQVYPKFHGGISTLRLFVYWTANGYQGGARGGCYNQNCLGFVQISNSVMVDGSYDNGVSQYNGDQHALSMQIRKDGGNFWLQINGENVGYWPDSLFNSLQYGATKVEWGGEIVNMKTDGKHSTTDMGSGHFADEGFKKASYFRNIMIFDETNTTPKDPVGIYPFVTNDKCYNLKGGVGGTPWGVHFYYGGPGQNQNCP